MSSANIPNTYRAGQFTQPGGQLEIREVQMPQLRENEVLIKVESCVLGSCDELWRNDLLPHLRFPATPGLAVVGEIVKMHQGGNRGSMGGRKLKEGMKYATADEHCVTEVRSGQFKGEETTLPVIAFDGGRVYSSIQRCERECKALDEAEKRALRQVNEKMGFKEDECALVIYGEGGFARLAIDTAKAYVDKMQHGMLPHMSNRHKVNIVLVAPSNRWSAKDYGLREEQVICLDRDQGNIEQRLKQYGGAQLTICADQPNKGLEQVLDGSRWGSTITLLEPNREGNLQIPLANILVKNIRIAGPPLLTHECLDHALEFASRHSIRVPARHVKFEQNELNQAWREMEDGSKFDAPVVCFERM
ncbi:hypothetical protein JCM10207_007091 [Rhodosporidiobolus poonsookiae]